MAARGSASPAAPASESASSVASLGAGSKASETASSGASESASSVASLGGARKLASLPDADGRRPRGALRAVLAARAAVPAEGASSEPTVDDLSPSLTTEPGVPSALSFFREKVKTPSRDPSRAFFFSRFGSGLCGSSATRAAIGWLGKGSPVF